MLQRIEVAGYRSVRDLLLSLSGSEILVGPNGCGKTNLYRALLLLTSSAQGQLARALADEGGVTSVLSAVHGQPSTEVRLGCRVDDWSYELQIGLPQLSPKQRAETAFGLDPEVHEERLAFAERGRKPIVFLERTNGRVKVRDGEGRLIDHLGSLLRSESALGQLHDPQQYPEVAALRRQLSGWRFYHQFDTGEASPLRRPQVGVFTPVLAHDGRDVAAALQSILEHGGQQALTAAMARAFPGCQLIVDVEPRRALFEVQLRVPNIARPLRAAELSDGTLRFLCLLAALQSPRPPELLVLNEPETSLAQDLLPIVAGLMADAARRSQLVMTTHSQPLAEAFGAATGRLAIEMRLEDGCTEVVGRSRYESDADRAGSE